jgi:GNAT superfamily N-acetyltransferase
MGVGSPLTQALAMGLQGPVDAAELDAVEALLSREGSVPQFELCPLGDPELFRELARRGYMVQEFQFAWSRPLEGPAGLEARAPEGVEIQPMADGEAFTRVVMAGFMDTAPDQVPAEVLDLMAPAAGVRGQQFWGAWADGNLVGGGTLFLHEGVAVLAGASVLPPYRRRGIQGALLRARLAEGLRAGCDLACSGTAPGSASQRNMERHGFRVAYPKVVLLKV